MGATTIFGIIVEFADHPSAISVVSVELSGEQGHSATRFDRPRPVEEVFVPDFVSFLDSLGDLKRLSEDRDALRLVAFGSDNVQLGGMRIAEMANAKQNRRAMLRFVTANGNLESLFKMTPADKSAVANVLQSVVQPALRTAHRVGAALGGRISPYPSDRLAEDRRRLENIKRYMPED